MFLRSAKRARRKHALHRLYLYAQQKDRPEARGLRLLKDWLSPQQRDQLDTFGYFDVNGSATGKKYRIHFGMMANVQEIGEDGDPICGWCFMPATPLVPGDVMLAQKIALETSEFAVLAVANRLPTIRRRRHIHRPF